MAEEVRDYFQDICRSDPQMHTASVGLMEGRHYKEWRRQNVEKLDEWSQTATVSNDLLAIELENIRKFSGRQMNCTIYRQMP